MSEHTRIKLRCKCKKPKFRDIRHCKNFYPKGSYKSYDRYWADYDYWAKLSTTYVIRFLQSNVGIPYNKVYYKLINKMKKSHIPMYFIKDVLNLVIVGKKEDTIYKPSFYITNGILNINKVTSKKKII